MSTFAKIPRVIVTGQKDGKSTILKDSKADNISEHIPGLIISDIWASDTMPVALEKTINIENTLFPMVPPNGSYVRYVVIPPDEELKKYIPSMADAKPTDPHPLMHKTETLDYIIILAGELYLILEDTETLLKPGDFVIQRGTNHAWSNRSDKPCIQLAILLDAKKESSS